jgi:hypothetical protein
MGWRNLEAAAPRRGIDLRFGQAVDVRPSGGEGGDELRHPIIFREDSRPLGSLAETLVRIAGLIRIKRLGARENAQIKTHGQIMVSKRRA